MCGIERMDTQVKFLLHWLLFYVGMKPVHRPRLDEPSHAWYSLTPQDVNSTAERIVLRKAVICGSPKEIIKIISNDWQEGFVVSVLQVCI